MEEQNEETVSFKPSDLIKFGILGYDGKEIMAELSGFDLKVTFNMRLINSVADAEACADAMAQVFYQNLMDQLLNKSPT